MHKLIITITIMFVFSSALEVFGDAEETRNTITVQTKSPKGAVTTLRQLIDRLKATGEKVARKGKVEQPFFSVKGRIITIGDQEVQVFEYPTVKAAELDARNVSGTGRSIGTTMPMWIAPPHFFKGGRLIVLYVGEKSSVLKTLEDALGPQFAGK